MEQKMKMPILTAILCLAIISAVFAASLVASWKIESTGEIATIGVEAYSDENCTLLCETLDWGLVKPGDIANVTVYVKNVEITPFTLKLNVTNWTPANATDHIMLEWNYTGSTLEPDDVLPVTLTLTVSLDIEGFETFSTDIYIVATET